MIFENTMALNGVSYFLCSLGYFVMGLVVVPELRRGAHQSSEMAFLGLLGIFGFARGIFYFGEFLFWLGFGQTSPLQAGGVHEVVWVLGDYITVLAFFAFALRLWHTVGDHRKQGQVVAGFIGYWALIIFAAARHGLDLSSIATWHDLKAFLICIPSYALVSWEFSILGRQYGSMGLVNRAQGFTRLMYAYIIQGILVFASVMGHVAMLPSMDAGPLMWTGNAPVMRTARAVMVFVTIYLLYSLLTSHDTQNQSNDSLDRARVALSSELGKSLVNQICYVLEMDTAGIFVWEGEEKGRKVYRTLAAQGFPATLVPQLTGSRVDLTRLEQDLSPGFKAVQQVEVSHGGRHLGAILVANRRRRPLSPEDRRFLNSLAGQVAQALTEIHELVDKVEAGAIQDERLRISREMHDGLSPLLACLRIKIQMAKDLLESSDKNSLNTALDEIDHVVEEAFVDVRESITNLRFTVNSSGFPEKVKGTVDSFERLSHVPVRVELYGTLPDIPPKVESQVLRIIQEALTNIRKHAGARSVTIILNGTGETLTVTVSDDGCGFDPSQVGSGHYGLSTMKERSTDIGGTLEVSSHVGTGTTVKFTISLSRWKGEPDHAENYDSGGPALVPGGVGQPDFH